MKLFCSLRAKLLAIILVVLIGFSVFHYQAISYLLYPGFNRLEEAEARDDMERLVGGLQREIQQVDTVCRNWAARDDVRRFLAEKTDTFPPNALSVNSFLYRHFNLVVFLDPQGEVLWEKTINLTTRDWEENPAFATLSFQAIAKRWKTTDDMESMVLKGVAHSDQGPMILSIRPVGRMDTTFTVLGTLVLGRFLDDSLITRLQEQAFFSYPYTLIHQDAFPEDDVIQEEDPVSRDRVFIKTISPDRLLLYTAIPLLGEENPLLLTIDYPRDITKQGEETLTAAWGFIFVLNLLFSFLLLVFVQQVILAPISALGLAISRIDWQSNPSLRLPPQREAELNQLAISVNSLLDRVQISDTQLRDSEDRLETVLQSVQVGIMLIDWETHEIIDVNPVSAKLIGKPKNELVGKMCCEYICPSHVGECPVTDQQLDVTNLEREIIASDGRRIPILKSAIPIHYNNRICILESFLDITERKQLETELKNLAMKDPLTGVNNRRSFMEKAQAEFERAKRYHEPFSLLMMDIDHFKAINDQYGHPVGDEVLKSLCQEVLRTLRNTDIFARMGGEEFAGLLLQTNRPDSLIVAERLRGRIEKLTVMANGIPVQFTASIGVTTMDGEETSFDRMLLRADDLLYQAKNRGRNQVVQG
jgi:diguanylate cyclase (GGDEF)-like protein/PAS domain S-box-containing protein